MTETSQVRAAARRDRAGHANPYVVLAIILTATFMQLVDISIVNVAIPSIQRDLHASYGQIQLVLVFYQLAFACTLITAARIGDIYGRRRIFLIGMTAFTLASVLCGAAPNAGVLVGSRLLQGLAAGLMFPQVLSVIQVTFPPRDRGRALGIVGATIGLATILGPLLGGILIQADIGGLGWRTIFYVNVPIGIGALIAAFFLLGESRAPGGNRLDLPGAGLVTLGVFLLVFPLVEGRDRGWPGWVWLMLAAAVPVLAVFAAYERRRTAADASPLLRMSLFRDRAFVAGLVLSFVFFAALPPFFFTLAVYLQIGLGFSALGSGLTGFPFAVGSACAAAASNALTKRLGRSILLLGTGLLVLGMCAVLLTAHVVGIHPHTWQFLPALLLSGVGLGLFIAPVVNIILAAIRTEAAGAASGVLSTVQQVGGAVGVAVIGVVFFGLLGVNSGRAAGAVGPQVRASLAAAHLPRPAQDAVLAGFRKCFHDRSHAKDPTTPPPSCRQRSGTTAPVGNALRNAGRVALAEDFSRSYQQALGYEIAVFALSFLLVFRLPRVDPHNMRPAGPPAEA
ncbi:MAG: DHA2 family efflux MFS transporter permease subunit [Actinomycetota bacterium]|nr:DHA2 family efflux MFS transporter permease subunit [Actinomycetota bacterium]